MLKGVKSNLSNVVLTEKIRCKNIPKRNKKIVVQKKEIRNKKEIKYAATNVRRTSTIAILSIL